MLGLLYEILLFQHLSAFADYLFFETEGDIRLCRFGLKMRLKAGIDNCCK